MRLYSHRRHRHNLSDGPIDSRDSQGPRALGLRRRLRVSAAFHREAAGFFATHVAGEA
jgi:hypothetical protein